MTVKEGKKGGRGIFVFKGSQRREMCGCDQAAMNCIACLCTRFIKNTAHVKYYCPLDFLSNSFHLSSIGFKIFLKCLKVILI